MDKKQLKQTIDLYKQHIEQDRTRYEQDRSERRERAAYYQSWTADRLRSMTEEDLYEYLAKLWAMLIWGNKKYAVDKLVEGNGFETLRTELAILVWSDDPIEARWDRFRKRIKGMILNLLKSLNNPAVQGVVAISDAVQIERIKKHAAGVAGLWDKLKCWNYKDVLEVHELLERVNESINSLDLVPQGF